MENTPVHGTFPIFSTRSKDSAGTKAPSFPFSWALYSPWPPMAVYLPACQVLAAVTKQLQHLLHCLPPTQIG